MAVLAVTGILHDDSRRARKRIPAKPCRAIGTKVRRHAGACAAAPQGVALHINTQVFRMGKDKADGPGQILTGGLCAGTVDQREGIVAHLAQLQRMGEAVVHRPHIGKAAACIADGKLRSRLAPEEEQAGIPFGRICRLLRLSVDVEEDHIPGCGMVVHVVDDLHRLVRPDVAVPGQAQLPQGFAGIVPLVHGEDQAAIITKDRIVHHIRDGRICRIGSILCQRDAGQQEQKHQQVFHDRHL